MNHSAGRLESLMGQVTSEFFERLSRGEDPQIEEYAEQYAEIAHLIRDTFPALKLMQDAVGDGSTSSPQRAAGPVAAKQQVGDFRILHEIGRGGMGVVYEANQLSLDRTVALKVLPLVAVLDEKAIQRFKNEAKAAATLNHPHIVPIHAVGNDRGIYYYAMSLIDGPTIAEVIGELQQQISSNGDGVPSIEEALRANELHSRREPPLDEESSEPFVEVRQDVDQSGDTVDKALKTKRAVRTSSSIRRPSSSTHYFRNVARLGQQAADALHCAHEHGIVHRDIKPGNLMIDGSGKLWVTDFGLAQIESDAGITMTGDLVGTLRYMSPEQALATRIIVDHRADIYSLGITLYELLTFRPAFDESDRKKLLRQIAFDEPRSPRAINDFVPRELQTIILKALSKDPDARYATANEMADDLGRFQKNEPILAQPPSMVERLRKWSLRHVGIVWTALAATFCLVVVLAVATSIVLSGQSALRNQRELAVIESGRAKAAKTLAQQRLIESQVAEARSQTLLYTADTKLASDAIKSGDAARSNELLQRHAHSTSDALRGFEWHFFRKRVSAPFSIELNLSGRVSDVEISPDGNLLAATAAQGKVVVCDTTEWKQRQTLDAQQTSANELAWSPDGRMLASACADGSLRVWDYVSGKRHLELSAHEGKANDVRFGPYGQHLYSCGDDGLVKQWDVVTGQQLAEFSGHQHAVEQIALSPDGQLLATASSDHHIAIWQSSTEKRLHHINTHSGRVVCIAFNDIGRLVAASTDRGYSFLVDARSGHYVSLPRQSDGVEALCFLPDRWLATADRGGAVQLQPLPSSLDESPAQVAAPIRWMAHAGRAIAVATLPGGRGLVSGGGDGMLRVWKPDVEAARWYTFRHADKATFATGKNSRLYVAGRKIFVWDIEDRRLVDSFAASEPPWNRVACSADGKYLAAVGGDQLVLFDVRTQRVARRWELTNVSNDPAYRLAISTNGRWIALANYVTEQDHVTVYDRERPQWLKQIPVQQCACVAFSPDNRWLAVGHMKDLRLFSFLSDDEPNRLTGHSNTLSDVDFSPDGRLLATVGHDRLLKVWQLPAGTEKYSIVAHRDFVKSVAFTSDGKTLATAGDDGVVKMWHAVTGQPLGQLDSERSSISQLQFGSNGLVLVGGLENRTVVVYDASAIERPLLRETPEESAKFFKMGDLPGGKFYSFPVGVSTDGRFAAGSSETENGAAVFRWSVAKGMQPFEAIKGTGIATDVSDDGRILCGTHIFESEWRSSRWTDSREPEVVTPAQSVAEDMTASGSHIVGRHWAKDHWKAFVWNAGSTLHSFNGDSEEDGFGISVSGAGDVNSDGFDDVIVGAPLDDSNGEDSGNARVFSGADGSLLFTFKGDATDDQFGYSARGAGDVNGDGFDDLIVGARFNDDSGTDSGGARVFSGQTGEVLFTFQGDSKGDEFGFSVSGAGDVNGDGFDDLIVGARLEVNNDGTSGTARVFSGQTGEVLFTFRGDSKGDEFGFSVSGAGDVNGDGFDDLIVGSRRDDLHGGASGSARVFSGADGGVLFTFSGDSTGDRLGTSVSGAGDVNGDGFDDLIAGAPLDGNNGKKSGSARVFSGHDGSVLYTFNGDSGYDRLGGSVSGAGDVNGDGFDDLIVGAHLDDNNGDRSGSARVFSGHDGSVLYTYNGDSAKDQFGLSVSGAGDVNGDGFDDLIVGIPRKVHSGSARVLLSPRTVMLPSSPDHEHAQATAVSSDGRIVLGFVFNAEGVEHHQTIEVMAARITDARPVIWRDKQLEFLPGFDRDRNWCAMDISDDGSVIVGVGWSPGINFNSPLETSAAAFRWEAAHVQLLGTLENCQHSIVKGVSGDGRIVVGRCTRQRGYMSDDIGFIWDAKRGIRAASEVLAAAGTIPSGLEMLEVTAISKDGSTIVGLGNNPEVAWEGWLAQLPKDYGEGNK